MKKALLVLTLLILNSVAFAQPEMKGNPEELRQFLHPSQKTITLYGEAEEKAYSDTAIVSLLITNEQRKLAAAIGANNDYRDSIRAGLEKQGISAENIKSSKFSTSPQYGWFGKKPDSYKVTNRMSITISDAAQLRMIAEVADSSEPVELVDMSFEHSEKESFKLKAKAKALDVIMAQKKFYEKNLGVSLTPVLFHDAPIHRYATAGARMLEKATVTESANSAMDSRSMLVSQDTSAEAPSFDEIMYRAELTVEFEITPTKP